MEKRRSLDASCEAKREELAAAQAAVAAKSEAIEREHQKQLVYRIYDCSEMIKVLRPFTVEEGASLSSLMRGSLSVADAKSKKKSLEQEMVSMQKELLGLEHKYGVAEVNLPKEGEGGAKPKPKETAADLVTAVMDTHDVKEESVEMDATLDVQAEEITEGVDEPVVEETPEERQEQAVEEAGAPGMPREQIETLLGALTV